MSTAVDLHIPVFPLPGIVLFPNSLLPLHIFEPRYRSMLEDVLAGDKQFIILNADAAGPNAAEPRSGSIGCVAEVIQIEKLKDGRSNILTVGRSRARLKECFRNKPYLCARVELIQDVEEPADDLSTLLTLKNNIAQLSRLTKTVYNRDVDELLRSELSAEELSFLVAGLLVIDPFEQQRILEMDHTSQRIKFLEPKLSSVSKKLAALAAIENAFKSDET